MRWLSIFALAMSLLLFGLSVVVWLQADARIEEALRRQERMLVVQHRATIINFCRDFRLVEPPANVETIGELLAPIRGLHEGLSK
ncbi:MAG: hypothetical protein L0Y70_04820 [Gemmataceae bacterium]|nr:hypothetical protein [Gemmataceae bacterium]